MLEALINKYRDPKSYDCSCSETIVLVMNEKYDLGIDEKMIKAMAPFSAGMYIGSVCGALTGALAVLGIMFTDKRAHKCLRTERLTKTYLKNFEKCMDSLDCVELKEKHWSEKDGCNQIILVAAQVLIELVNQELGVSDEVF